MKQSKIYIMCIEDESEVLASIVKDISSFEKVFPIETAKSAEEGRGVMQKLLAEGHRIGLILCDHLMPGDSGVDLLIELQGKEETINTRKVLLTGQAGLEPTIKAVNEAHLDYYIAKPWTKEELISVVKKQLTSYVLQKEKDFMQYMNVLDPIVLSDAMRQRGISDR